MNCLKVLQVVIVVQNNCASGLKCIIVTYVFIRTYDTFSYSYNLPSKFLRTLLYHSEDKSSESAASVHSFSPVISSAQTDSTSELLLFL
jgi:hypothetical protein